MKIRDGFKFGIGFVLGKATVGIVCDMLDKHSRLRKQWDRCVNAFKGNEPKAQPIKNIRDCLIKKGITANH